MTDAELEFLRAASAHFARANLVVRAANLLGRPVEALVRRALPEKAAQLISSATRSALDVALNAALKTLPLGGEPADFAGAGRDSRTAKWGHAALASGAGAVGGFFGLAALPLELPVTTGIILRSVASVARNYGEDLSRLEARLECLNVFALSGASEAEDAGYYGIRIALQEHLRATTRWAARMSLDEIAAAASRGDAPVLVRLLVKIAERFEVRVTEKALLQAVPVLSAASAAVLNVAFAEHVGQTAVYHFGIRALERRYGEGPVSAAYLAAKDAPA